MSIQPQAAPSLNCKGMGKAAGLLLNSSKDPLWASEVSERGVLQLIEKGVRTTAGHAHNGSVSSSGLAQRLSYPQSFS